MPSSEISFLAIEAVERYTPLTWYEMIIVGGALIGAVWVIWQKLIYPILNIVRNVEKLYPIIPKIDRIAKEFDANGGESLRDRVVNLNENVGDLKEDFSEFKEEVYADLNFLNSHVIRTREGAPYNGMEERKEHRTTAKRSRFPGPWKK